MLKSRLLLDKRWKEVLFSFAGFGPNLLMVLMMAYFTDALIPTGLSADIDFWSYGGVIIVYTGVFPVLWTISRIFDGFIDVPLAGLADSFGKNTKKRAITMFISFFPMVASFVCCWIPVFGFKGTLTTGQQVGNTIWIFVMAIIFFASYTLALIVFYGSLSEVCTDGSQRARVSAYKSVFDTISYALVYALIPFVFKSINIPIWKVALMLSPLMLTIFIPVFMLKKTEVNDEEESDKSEKISFGKSIALTFSSKPFIKWLIVNCVSFFGLQMFLVSQNALISGVMGLGASYAAILNTCAFAPVPLMLYLYNRLHAKKGLRFAYQTCLLAFAISILSFCCAGTYFWGDKVAPKLIIGGIGGICGSWGIGAFFMTPYLVPTQIAAVEKEITGKNHSAMYFAIQALATSAVGAIASSLIYDYLKQWVVTSGSTEWKCGVSLVPLIVSIMCFAGFFLCFLMPKQYSALVIAKDLEARSKKRINSLNLRLKQTEKNKVIQIEELKKHSLDKKDLSFAISQIEEKSNKISISLKLKIERNEKILEQVLNYYKKIKIEENQIKLEKEGIFAVVGLTILSGFIFGIFELFFSMSKLNILGIKISKKEKVFYILSLFIPFLNIYTNYSLYKKIDNELNNNNIKHHNFGILNIVTSIVLPLFCNVVAIAIRADGINKIIDCKTKEVKNEK